MTTWRNKVIVPLGYVIATAIILAALLVSLGRLLTPVLNDHLTELEAWSSQMLHTPVKFHHVIISWDYYEPELSIRKVVFLDKKTQQPKIAIQNITINFNIIRSLLNWQLLPESIQVTGVHLTINQLSSSRFDIEKLTTLSLKDQETGAPTDLNEIFSWIFTQANLGLRDIDITYHALNGEMMSISLNRLTLNNSSDTHNLMGDAILNQKIPSHVLIDLNWKGDVTDLKHASINLYLYLQGVSFPQWISNETWQNLQITQGLGSAKIWAKWDNSQWQQIQSQLEIYDLEIVSTVTNKSQQIPRLNGHVGWKREGMNQVFAGEDILIDLPKHLWPNTNFEIMVTPAVDGSHALQAIKLGYFDISDAQKMVLASGLLSERYQKIILALNPKGEIHQFKCEFPNGLSTDMTQASASAQFTNLSLNAWEKLPGLSHFTGAFRWHANEGEIDLNCTRAKLTWDSVFANSLQFNQLLGTVDVKNAEDGAWTFNTKKFHANSEDIDTETTLKITFPKNDSTSVDLSADFHVAHAEHVANYLPLKLFDADLSHWLRHAFSGGQLESGKAVFKGRLADYPFEKGNGNYLVTGTLRDVDLNYDPAWPTVRRMNGALAFSNDSLIVDLISGQILDAPIKQAHGIISHLSGVDPLLLNIAGILESDLTQVMRFIRISPLKKNLGADLEGLQLSGPMRLDLSLAIPLNKPDDTKVQGDATLKNARLLMPSWNLALDQLKGALHFTEKDIQSNPMQGNLLGESATLTLSTQFEENNSSYLKAMIKSMVSVSELETWLKTSLSQIVQGASEYQAELHLPSHDSKQPKQIILKSNLKGIIVNLPEQFGKQATEERNLSCTILLNPNQLLLAKVHYGDVLSAAIAFKQAQPSFQFLGGELRLDSREAQYAGQKGLMVAVQLKQLDWKTIQPYYDWANKKSNQPSSVKSLKFSAGLFRGADVRASLVDLFGVKLNDAVLQIIKIDGSWTVNINSKQLAGILKMAANLSSIQGKLKYFYFSPSNGKLSKIDPKTLPALSLSINDFRYQDKNLGQVTFDTVPSRNGMTIKNVQIISPYSQLHASGSWQLANGTYNSYLQGNFITARLSNVLTQWGLGAKGLIGRNGSAKFILSWDDAPFSPTFVGLSGQLSLQLGEGRIVNLGNSTDAKIGIGRLLNLLSLQSIPRRLSLNFSDLSGQGYSFDIMQGDFYLKNGNAITSNTYFNGPVARVNIAGRIGLLTKDYDMILSITPYVTSSLPLVATIATGNPIVGAAAWAVEKVVGKAVSQLTTYRYKITGSWENPNWEQGASNSKGRQN